MKKAFTLIELLVVIAIIAILAAILVPCVCPGQGSRQEDFRPLQPEAARPSPRSCTATTTTTPCMLTAGTAAEMRATTTALPKFAPTISAISPTASTPPLRTRTAAFQRKCNHARLYWAYMLYPYTKNYPAVPRTRITTGAFWPGSNTALHRFNGTLPVAQSRQQLRRTEQLRPQRLLAEPGGDYDRWFRANLPAPPTITFDSTRRRHDHDHRCDATTAPVPTSRTSQRVCGTRRLSNGQMEQQYVTATQECVNAHYWLHWMNQANFQLRRRRARTETCGSGTQPHPAAIQR